MSDANFTKKVQQESLCRSLANFVNVPSNCADFSLYLSQIVCFLEGMSISIFAVKFARSRILYCNTCSFAVLLIILVIVKGWSFYIPFNFVIFFLVVLGVRSSPLLVETQF